MAYINGRRIPLLSHVTLDGYDEGYKEGHEEGYDEAQSETNEVLETTVAVYGAEKTTEKYLAELTEQQKELAENINALNPSLVSTEDKIEALNDAFFKAYKMPEYLAFASSAGAGTNSSASAFRHISQSGSTYTIVIDLSYNGMLNYHLIPNVPYTILIADNAGHSEVSTQTFNAATQEMTITSNIYPTFIFANIGGSSPDGFNAAVSAFNSDKTKLWIYQFNCNNITLTGTTVGAQKRFQYQAVGVPSQTVTSPYFSINAATGELSLTAEGQTLETVVIPKYLMYRTVESLSADMFKNNTVVKKIVLPEGLASIPANFADGAKNLETIYNTEAVTTVGNNAFAQTALKRINLDSLTSIGTGVFSKSALLQYANVGNITTVPKNTFYGCQNLITVEGLESVTTIGEAAFFKTGWLENVDLTFENLTSVGQMAFKDSKFVYDWESLTGCTFGTYATYAQMNFGAGWKDCTAVKKTNPLLVKFNQNNTEWVNTQVGIVGTGETYSNLDPEYDAASGKTGLVWQYGCSMYSMSVAYLGLKHPNNDTLTSPQEVEELMRADLGQNLFKNYYLQSGKYAEYPAGSGTYLANTEKFIRYFAGENNQVGALGMKAEWHTHCNAADFQALYDALDAGKYAMLFVPSSSTNTQGHVIAAYGVDDDKNILVSDSAAAYCFVGRFDAIQSKIPLQNLISGENKMYKNGQWIDNPVTSSISFIILSNS